MKSTTPELSIFELFFAPICLGALALVLCWRCRQMPGKAVMGVASLCTLAIQLSTTIPAALVSRNPMASSDILLDRKFGELFCLILAALVLTVVCFLVRRGWWATPNRSNLVLSFLLFGFVFPTAWAVHLTEKNNAEIARDQAEREQALTR